jgi:lipid A 3-O-deacylase
MRTCGGCHLSVTIGSASTSCRSSALRSAISTLTGKQGCCSGLAGLGADYGPVRIRPALSGTDYFDAEDLDEGRGYYFFAGTQGRVVGRNIFLGGNSFRTSPSVSKKNLVGDAQAGFSVLWSKSLRLDISVALCTEEFHGQRTSDDSCTAALSFTW